MILKSLALQLRNRDWSAVFLEILIVIVGILAALQLDNWNQDRKDRVQAEIWRAAIIEDMRATQRSLRARVTYYEQALAFAEASLPALMSTEPVSHEEAWDIVLGAFQAGQIWPLRISGFTYQEVQAAGMFDIISSRSVLTKLANYYEVTAYDATVIAGGSPPIRDMIREKTPWPLQRYIWNSDCQSHIANEYDGGFFFFLRRCDKPDLDEDILAALQRFRADLDLQDKLRGRMSQLMIVNAAFSRNVEHIEEIIQEMISTE